MRAAPADPKGRRQLDELRRKIKAMESPAGHAGAGGFAAGTDALTLAPGLHEVCPASYLDTPAALAFQTALLARHGGKARPGGRARPVLWVVPPCGAPEQDFGRPCPATLKTFGLDPARILLVEARDPGDALWAMEEGGKAGALVMGETGRSARYDLTASKRLHRAAREQGVPILVLRSHDGAVPSAALTRWRIAARPSEPQAWHGASGLAALGAYRFHAHLERVRGGPPRMYEIEWKNETFHVLEPAPLVDRAAPDAPLYRLAG